MSGRQRIVPMLSYEDAAAAVDWLCSAYGFVEDRDVRHTTADGTVTHAEIALDGARVMLATPNADYRSPRELRRRGALAGQPVGHRRRVRRGRRRRLAL